MQEVECRNSFGSQGEAENQGQRHSGQRTITYCAGGGAGRHGISTSQQDGGNGKDGCMD